MFSTNYYGIKNYLSILRQIYVRLLLKVLIPMFLLAYTNSINYNVFIVYIHVWFGYSHLPLPSPTLVPSGFTGVV